MGAGDVSEDNTHYQDIPDYNNTVPTGETFDGVLEGHHYSPDPNGPTTTLTYSFAGPGSQYDSASYSGRNWPNDGLTRLSDADIQLFEAQLQFVSNITNLEFQRVEDGGTAAGTIRPVWFKGTSETFSGYAEAPYPPKAAAGDIWFSQKILTNGSHNEFGRILIHELGHALGLKHPHEPRPGFPVLDTEWLGREYTIMSYKVSVRHGEMTQDDIHPQTFMYLDIQALQHMYGVDTVTTGGNDTYTYSQKTAHYLTIWDAGGIDTLEVTGGSRPVQLDLRPGSWSNVGSNINYNNGTPILQANENKTIFITPDVTIENAVGADGHDLITGNDAANVLKGNDGNDSMYGGARNDTLWAGKSDTGNDLLVGGSGNDTLGGGAGNDFLVGGDEQADGSDKLYGGDGDDTLIGGGWQDTILKNKMFETGEEILTSTEADVIWAGSGNDLILAAGGNDTIGAGTGNDQIEAGGGDDRIFAYSGDDTVSGEAGNDLIFSGSGADSINGGDGNDTLWGGSGDDTLTGGDGSDTFGFTAGSGTDTITDFNIKQDALLLSETFNTSADIAANSTDTDPGVLIDLGEGTSLLLTGLSTSDIDQLTLA